MVIGNLSKAKKVVEMYNSPCLVQDEEPSNSLIGEENKKVEKKRE